MIWRMAQANGCIVRLGKVLRLVLPVVLVLGLGPMLAQARPRCAKPCKEETARCTQTRCADMVRETRRACIETCRGIGGCAPIRTLAYVVSECRTDSRGFHQALYVRRGNCAPVNIMELDAPVELPAENCALYGGYPLGHFSVLAGAFQRLAVSPDGLGVVFEVTEEAALFPHGSLPPETEGLYFVGADGRDLRRLGPPSGVPLFGVHEDTSSPSGYAYGGLLYPHIDFSLDGRRIIFTDWGPGPAGEPAIQIMALELASGHRRQVTRLPFARPSLTAPYEQATSVPRFVRDDTILFVSSSNPEGLNPEAAYDFFTVNTDGSNIREVGTPIASAGSQVDPKKFVIAGGGTNLMNMAFVDVDGSSFLFQEVFILDGKRLLQLTSFRRPDTGRRFLTTDRRRVFFVSTADPLGTNPSGNCQLFSVSTLGTHMRQITALGNGEHSVHRCGDFDSPPGCAIQNAYQDPVTREVVFYSNCDPFDTKTFGGQIFAMRPDGTRLRQLTATRGRVFEAGGAVSVELAGPIAYSARLR
jgi:hypothetical protein